MIEMDKAISAENTELEERVTERMHGPMGYNSQYSDFVDSACEAHLKDLLSLALSGQFVKRTKTSLPPLEENVAKESVQDTVIRLLQAIEKRNPKVLEIILAHDPGSSVVRFLLILMLQRSIIDLLRKNGRYVSERDLEWANRVDAELEDERLGSVEWLADQIEPNWHTRSREPDASLARHDLEMLFSRAVAAGKLNEKYQRVFRTMLDGYALGLDDDAIANNLELGKQDFQRLRYKIIQKLHPFADS